MDLHSQTFLYYNINRRLGCWNDRQISSLCSQRMIKFHIPAGYFVGIINIIYFTLNRTAVLYKHIIYLYIIMLYALRMKRKCKIYFAYRITFIDRIFKIILSFDPIQKLKSKHISVVYGKNTRNTHTPGLQDLIKCNVDVTNRVNKRADILKY